MEAIKDMLKSTPEHILKARDIARSIYKENPEKHSEMLKEIKMGLITLYEIGLDQISKI